MRKLILLTMLAAGNTLADNSPFYVGVGFGMTNLDESTSFDALPQPEQPVFLIDDEVPGWQAFVGFDLLDRWAVEVGYTDLGSNDSDNVAFDGINNFIPLNVEIEAEGYYIDGIYRYPASTDTTVDLTLGYFFGRLTTERSSCCGFAPLPPDPSNKLSFRDDGVKLGVGVTVDMTATLDLRVNATYYDVTFEDPILGDINEEPWRVGLDLIWDF